MILIPSIFETIHHIQFQHKSHFNINSSRGLMDYHSTYRNNSVEVLKVNEPEMVIKRAIIQPSTAS